MRRPALLLALLLAAACSHHPASTAPRAAAGAALPPAGYYDSPGGVPEPLKVERLRRTEHSEVYRVLLPARVAPGVAEVPRVEDPIEIHYMLPYPAGATRRPLVLMMPILSNRMLLMREFASGFVRQGYAVGIVPRKDLAFEPRRSVELAEQELRVLVMRLRQALDWLARRPRVDPERVGVFGVSAGAMLGASLMGADERIDAGVFVFAGGPLADVMVDTTEERFTRKTAAIRAQLGWGPERVRAELARRIRTDPVILAPRIRREDVLLFIATEDDSVPTRNQRILWERLGRPEMHELRAGHYAGVALFLPFLLSTSQAFLGRKLGAP